MVFESFMEKLAGTATALVLVFIATVVVAESSYPTSWPPPITAKNKECSISGTYEWKGELFSKNGGSSQTSFMNELFPYLAEIKGEKQFIRLELDKETYSLKVVVLSNDYHVIGSTLFKKKPVCDGGWLTYESIQKWTGDGTPMQQKRILRIGKAEDGSLVARRSFDVESKHLFVFSKKRSDDIWYRFKSV